MKSLRSLSVGNAPQPGAKGEAQDAPRLMLLAMANNRNLSGDFIVSWNSFAFPSLLGCERTPYGEPLASCVPGDCQRVSSEAFFGPPLPLYPLLLYCPAGIWQYAYVRLCVRT